MGNRSGLYKIAFWVLAAAGLILALLAHWETRFPGDLPLTLAFQSVESGPLLAAMRWVSYVTGSWRGAILVVAAAFIFWRYLGGLEGVMIAFTGLCTTVNEVFKIAVDRPRPAAELVDVLVSATGKSFPSGHAFFAMAVLGMTAYLIAVRQERPRLRVLTVAVFALLILWIGASRVYLGVHWTSDVVGGYIIGAVFLMIEIWIYWRLKGRFASGSS